MGKRERGGEKEGRPGEEEGEGNVKMLLWGCPWCSQKEVVLV